jgi:exonuclease SbcC
MRIHRLEIEGFGPFRDLQIVDFDAFANDGIFLIGGKTGAGKSSILDAVCFALYGGVPRYEDGERRLRSDHSSLDEPTRVRLEFSTGDQRWRVERVPTYERRKRSGHGTTISAAEARLEEWVDGGWIGRAARPVDVGNELGPILGLTQQQFLQVILLAQGRFARFLLAKNDERQALLRTLFDSHRFEEYEQALESRRRETADRLSLENRVLLMQLESAEALAGDTETAADTVDEVAPAAGAASRTLDERLQRVTRALLRAAHERELSSAREHTAKDALAAADKDHAAAVAKRASQQRRDRARAALAQLEGRAEAIAADRTRLARAQDAEVLRGSIDASRRAASALDAAIASEQSLREAWISEGRTDADPRALDHLADSLAGDVGAFKLAQAAESALDKDRAQRAGAAEILAAVETELAQLEARRAQLPGATAELAAAIAEATARAAKGPELDARLADARGRRAAAFEVETRSAAVAAAQSGAHAAGRALTQASAKLDALRDRRFRDHAGELAELLVPGEPCPVCGSCEHPAPTPRGDDPVTDERIAAAEAAKDAAVSADAAAAASLREAENALVDASARAAGRSLGQAEADVAAVESDLQKIEAALLEREQLELDRARLEAEAVRLGESHADLTRGRDTARTALATLDQSISLAEASVTAARGEHASVAARIADLERVSAAARALAAAQRLVQTHRTTSVAAAADLAERLAASPFDDATEATGALLDAAERARVDATLHRHDAELAAQKQTLLELELEMLPESPVDVAATEGAAGAAAGEWRMAVARHTEAARLAAQLDEACEAARIAHEAIAELAEEAAVIEQLANSVAGRAPNTLKMNLETFVLAAELEVIVSAANVRLDEMSQGRYRLQHTDSRAARGAASGLGIEVLDAYTGHARPVQSLSGGETFLASLALALGLAEVVTARAGGIRLDTLFIDEGFGSLDADTLDIAMRTLDELRQGGRVIGVISHVDAMKDQLAARVLVETTDQGPSVIRQDADIRV